MSKKNSKSKKDIPRVSGPPTLLKLTTKNCTHISYGDTHSLKCKVCKHTVIGSEEIPLTRSKFDI
jgi:hypothetical protein